VQRLSAGTVFGTARLVVSPDGADASVTIHQDARLYVTALDAAQQVAHRLARGRFAWVQVVRGAVEVNGTKLAVSDGAAISGEETAIIVATAPAEVLLFDLP
jgi:redox-sensitive bicupin YhaK (pirin superfamily)